ncbi:MAG: threonine--tRNA ligase [Planctomycetales bacterium]|nr:threonine--tRNA ligase [Planctomycetales bacterium]
MLQITLPDGSVREYPAGVTPLEVARQIGPGLAKAAVAAEVDGRVRGLDEVLPAEGAVRLSILTRKDPPALDVMRHSCAHVMARAVMRLFDGVQLAFGPTITGGFYYDFQLDHALSEEDFPAIEEEMRKIVKLDEPFERLEEPRQTALDICSDLHQPLKVEHIQTGLADDAVLSFYRQGEFLDLCRGPHVPSARSIGSAFKLLSVAGAYWKGDSSRQQLQRLYATAFWDQKELDQHLLALEEAKRRDHRLLGRQLGLFEIDDQVGQGLILWKPKGALIRQLLQDFILEHLRRQGYEQVFTPHIGKLELYKTSGHFPYYQESQFPPLVDREQIERMAGEGCSCAELANRMKQGEIDGYLLKPMNCPHHIRIYASQPHSYRDLPVRLAEFGTVYRWEQSGELGGMTRVRGFTQDDAHLFVTEEQLPAEIEGCLELVKIVLGTLGMSDYRVRVGLRNPADDKYVGTVLQWEKAEEACRRAAATLGVPFTEEVGEAAFYGPKIDFVVRDVIGRQWQLGTVQVDYQLPDRFDLTYIGADNKAHRPVMVHRAPFGSLERFMGVLIEHFAGAFPLWLAPEQVRVCTVSEKSEGYGRGVERQMREAGLRVKGDYRPEKLGAKIRDWQLEKVPYAAVVGPKDEQAGSVSLRDRVDGRQETLPLAEALSRLQSEIDARQVRQIAPATAPTGGPREAHEY